MGNQWTRPRRGTRPPGLPEAISSCLCPIRPSRINEQIFYGKRGAVVQGLTPRASRRAVVLLRDACLCAIMGRHHGGRQEATGNGGPGGHAEVVITLVHQVTPITGAPARACTASKPVRVPRTS